MICASDQFALCNPACGLRFELASNPVTDCQQLDTAKDSDIDAYGPRFEEEECEFWLEVASSVYHMCMRT